MTKADLRTIYKQKRAKLTPEIIESESLKIANQLLKLPVWEYEFYHLFLSITEQNEVNTDYILNILSGKDKHIIVSKSDFKASKMTHYLLTDNTIIKKNNYNIPEPFNGIQIDTNKIEVVFVPLLAFDKQGHRVGYGKGYYDCFLSECKPEIIKIGLSFFEAENEIKNTFEADIKLDYCVTPSHVYGF